MRLCSPTCSPGATLGVPGRVRGGDGTLSVSALRIDGAALPSSPVCALPPWRVSGRNAPEAALRTLTNVLVAEERAAHATDAWVSVLSLDAWQQTAAAIFHHETGHRWHQFTTATERRRWAPNNQPDHFWGSERGMPFFGPPPTASASSRWTTPPSTTTRPGASSPPSAAASATSCAPKPAPPGTASKPFATPLTRRERAVFQREVVRRYNGGREFARNAANTDWVIRPSSRPYPNRVFSGAAQQIPYNAQATVEFPDTAYGPGI